MVPCGGELPDGCVGKAQFVAFRARAMDDGAMADDVIVAQHLTKSYGATRGVIDLSFSVHAGEVFGFLGPNGAGKSTTIRTMLDLIRPTDGRIEVFGVEPRAHPTDVHARIGYVPGEFGFYERMHVREYLEAFASFRDGAGRDRIEPLADLLRLDLDRPIHELSHGNKQKAGLVQAFMHDPDLLVLDEPTQGLDPLVQQTFYGLVDEVRGLLAQGVPPDAKPLGAIGYRHVLANLDNSCAWNDTIRMIQRDTRRYAKRQLTWFRRLANTMWFGGPGENKEIKEEVHRRVNLFLGEFYGV